MASNAKTIVSIVLLTVITLLLSLVEGTRNLQQMQPPMMAGTPEAIAAPLTAQVSPQNRPSSATNAVGQSLLVNGRAIAAPWVVSAGQLLVEESGAIQALGLELLSTSDYNIQPIRWFSEAQWLDTTDESQSLSTVLATQYRLLNVTELVNQEQWQWQAQSDTLQISTPPAQVVGVRQSSQSWGDRIVVDLDQPTPWQILKNGSELVIAVDASLDLNEVTPTALQPGSRVSAIQLEEPGQQTLLRVTKPASLYAQARTLAAPNRIVIDLQPAPTTEFSIHWAPGLWWHQKLMRSEKGIVPVIALELDWDEPALAIHPIWAQQTTVEGTQPLMAMAQQWQAIAAINGGFFNRNNRLPLGAIRHQGNWMSGPILNRGAIAWTSDGKAQVGRLSMQETIRTESGSAIALKHLNSGYVQAGVSRYTPDWGSSYSPLTDYETVVTVQNDEVTQQQRIEQAGQIRVPIPSDGYLLAVRADSSALDALNVGTQVSLDAATFPDSFASYSEILGAGPLLIQDRQIVLNPQAEEFSESFSQQNASRSAVGITAQNHWLLVIAQKHVDGAGIGLGQMANLMQQLGATDALNLDGGSSTTLTLGLRVLNDSPESIARVNNGIGVFFSPDIDLGNHAPLLPE